MFTALTSDEILEKKPFRTALLRKLKDNLDYLYGVIGSGAGISGVPNGSFEIDSDGDGTPDAWTKDLYPGGTFAINTATPDHGAAGVSFTHPGGASNGGGVLTPDYIECSELISYAIGFITWATAAGMKNKVQIQYYDQDKIANGAAVNAYNSTSNPTSPTLFAEFFTPIADSRFLKIVLIGGYTDTDVPGEAYFDGIFLMLGISATAVTAGDSLMCANDAEYTGTTTTSYVKKKEIQIDKNAVSLRVKFDLFDTSSGLAYGKIYLNGVATGTERSNNSQVYVTYSQDFTGPFFPGDLFQLYLKDDGGPEAHCKNFRIYENGYTITL